MQRKESAAKEDAIIGLQRKAAEADDQNKSGHFNFGNTQIQILLDLVLSIPIIVDANLPLVRGMVSLRHYKVL